jgi:hypothetical protein
MSQESHFTHVTQDMNHGVPHSQRVIMTNQDRDTGRGRGRGRQHYLSLVDSSSSHNTGSFESGPWIQHIHDPRSFTTHPRCVMSLWVGESKFLYYVGSTMTNNWRMDGTNMGRVQWLIVGYAEDNTLVDYWAPYDSLHLNDASLSNLLYGLFHCCMFVIICWMNYVFVGHLCWYDNMLDNLWCTNA